MPLLSPERTVGPVTTLAYCWRIVRRDGLVLGFTSHDRAIRADGVEYSTDAGLESAAIETPTIQSPHVTELTGVISAHCFSGEDLRQGRYDGAWVDILLLDWAAPEAGTLPVASGRIGRITVEDNRFRADVLSALDELSRRGLPRCSATCRAELGDAQCGVDRVPLELRVAVRELDDTGRLRVDRDLGTDGRFLDGYVLSLSGVTSGRDWRIENVGSDWLMLAGSGIQPGAGDALLLRPGCDKQPQTCRDRYSNFLNFRGEPAIPGSDYATRRFGP